MRQTYIARIIDGNGDMIGFERFGCKKVETVRNNMYRLFQNDIYRACNRTARKLRIYATPDGYHIEDLKVEYDIELNG